MPARHVALQRYPEVRLRKHCYSKVGHVLAVRVEDAAHGISRQLDGPDYVGGIHVGQSCHNTGSLAGSLLNRGYSILPYDNRTVDGVTGSNRRERRAIAFNRHWYESERQTPFRHSREGGNPSLFTATNPMSIMNAPPTFNAGCAAHKAARVIPAKERHPVPRYGAGVQGDGSRTCPRFDLMP